MEKYIKTIKDTTRGRTVQSFDSIEISDHIRNKLVESTYFFNLRN
jgi:hypothetical protein